MLENSLKGNDVTNYNNQKPRKILQNQNVLIKSDEDNVTMMQC
jgi:hypothetical protein